MLRIQLEKISTELRRIAKEIKGTEEAVNFLSELPHRYYEENLVHFFLIAEIRDFDECVKAVETFLPYVDCWPVCDQSSPKVFARNHERLLPLILAKRYDESVVYVEERRLEPWTHKKAIQKALESYRVSDEHKEYLKTLR